MAKLKKPAQIDGSRARLQPINYVLKIQAVLLVVTVICFFLLKGGSAAFSAGFGGAIVIANTMLQRWHLIQSAHSARADAGMNLRKAYRCVVERWVLTIAMFSIGFAVMHLAPLPLLIGFIATQCALFFGNTNQA